MAKAKLNATQDKGTTTMAKDKKGHKADTTAAPPVASTVKSWHTSGSQAYEDKRREDLQREALREKQARRFYLRPQGKTKSLPTDESKDYEARLVFLDDDDGFGVLEHRVVPGGDWSRTAYLTCTKDYAPPCSVCQAIRDNKPSRTVYFTAIDLRKYPKKDGTISKFRRVLFPAKGDSIGELLKLKEANGGSLAGLVVDVRRVGDKSPACGTHFSVYIKDGRVVRVKNPTEKFGAEQGVVFDYFKLLSPWNAEQLATLGIKPARAAGSPEEVSAELGDDDTGVDHNGTAEAVDDNDEVVDLD